MNKSTAPRMIDVMKLVVTHKLPLLISAIFLLYLLTIPQLVALMVPCLKPLPGRSYSFDDCRVLMALDRYLLLALVGFAVAVLGLFFISRQKRLKPIAATALTLAILIIVLFHVYIPQAEAQIRSAPIYLDSLR